MSILICFGNRRDAIWGGQSWLYLRLIEDIEDKFVFGEEIKKIFDTGELFQCLDIPSIEGKSKRIQIVSLIKETIVEIIVEIIADNEENLIKSMVNDGEGYKRYREMLPDLLHCIEEYEAQQYPIKES